MMAITTQTPDWVLDLSSCWTPWKSIVEAALDRRTADLRNVEWQYSEIHQRLLQACDGISRDPRAPSAETLHEIRQVARPWLTLRALQEADFPILTNLWKTCQRLDADITHRCIIQPSTAGPQQFKPARLLVFTFVLILILIVAGVAIIPDTSIVALTAWLSRAHDFAAGADALWKMGTLIGILTISAAYWVFRAPRSY